MALRGPENITYPVGGIDNLHGRRRLARQGEWRRPDEYRHRWPGCFAAPNTPAQVAGAQLMETVSCNEIWRADGAASGGRSPLPAFQGREIECEQH